MAKGFDCFPLWLNDWFGSTARAILSPAARSAYLELLFRQYSMGSKSLSILPSKMVSSDEAIAVLIGFEIDDWLAVKNEVLPLLERTEDGGLSNAKVAKDVSYRLSRVAGGKARSAQRSAQRSAPAKHIAQPSSSSSSSSSSSISSSKDLLVPLDVPSSPRASDEEVKRSERYVSQPGKEE